MIKFDFENLFKDNGVKYWTEGKNVSLGEINTKCCFCDDGSNHLRFDPKKGRCRCWRCGPHPLWLALKKLTGLEWNQVRTKYTNFHGLSDRYGDDDITIPRPESIRFPFGTGPMQNQHIKYLQRRGYSADALARDYGLLGTSHLGQYCHRIVAPIYFKGRLVSYQCRDITDRANLRYKACAVQDEIIHHKDIVYDYDRADPEHVLVVEGIADAWRMGRGSVATFGTGYTPKQVTLLSEFKRVTIMYDFDAVSRADALADELAGLGVDTAVAMLKKGDPGQLDQDEADAIMAEIMGG